MSMIFTALSAPQPHVLATHPASARRRTRLLGLVLTVSLAIAAAAPMAAAAPTSHIHPFGPCPGVQIGC